MKPKQNGKGDIYIPAGTDACQTPAYALGPLLPYLQNYQNVWESACGRGWLMSALLESGIGEVVGSDLAVTGHNFFDYTPDDWECQVTNPPYRIKYQWLRRSYELGKPFALLLPVETIGAKAAQVLFDRYGVEIIFMHPRVDFYMPQRGFKGKGAQFPVAWFCSGLSIGKSLTFADISKEKKLFKEQHYEEMVD